MANAKVQINIQNNEETVLSFVRTNSKFLYFSKEEPSFRMFRTALQTGLSGAKFSLIQLKNQENLNIVEQVAGQIKSAQHILATFDIKQITDAGVIRDLRIRFPKEQAPVIVIIPEMGDNEINLLREMGANNILVNPYSPINLIEKIANTLKPSGLSEVIENCQKLLAQKEYAAVLRVCDRILRLKPGSSAAHMLKGDAHLAMSRDELESETISHKQSALNLYTLAWEGNSKYIEPIKRLINFHKEDGNVSEQVKFLKELDKLSPLSIERKIEIGFILVLSLKEKEEGTKYLDMAIDLAKNENNDDRLEEISKRIVEAVAESDSELVNRYAL
jgi:DNA-binding response OmpR family regulator